MHLDQLDHPDKVGETLNVMFDVFDVSQSKRGE